MKEDEVPKPARPDLQPSNLPHLETLANQLQSANSPKFYHSTCQYINNHQKWSREGTERNFFSISGKLNETHRRRADSQQPSYPSSEHQIYPKAHMFLPAEVPFSTPTPPNHDITLHQIWHNINRCSYRYVLIHKPPTNPPAFFPSATWSLLYRFFSLSSLAKVPLSPAH
jgi:hypothetical protein